MPEGAEAKPPLLSEVILSAAPREGEMESG